MRAKASTLRNINSINKAIVFALIERLVKLHAKVAYLALSTIFGTIDYIWHYRLYLALSTIFGTIDYIWHYRLYLALSTIFGTIDYIWHYRLYLALSTIFGTIDYIWHYQLYLALSTILGRLLLPSCYLKMQMRGDLTFWAFLVQLARLQSLSLPKAATAGKVYKLG